MRIASVRTAPQVREGRPIGYPLAASSRDQVVVEAVWAAVEHRLVGFRLDSACGCAWVAYRTGAGGTVLLYHDPEEG